MALPVRSTARHALCAIGLVAVTASSLLAQGTVRGRVTDASTRPLPDVTITVAGTSLGATTNATGDYTIANVPSGQQTITSRRIGYARGTIQVTVPGSGEVRADFVLNQAATTLEQVVVTGTAGSLERREVGNSITTVDVAELISKNSIANVTEALQGKTPGLIVLPGSGVPGTAAEIRIRGASGTSGYKPVVFIDGVRYNIDDVGGFSATGGGTAGLAQSTQVTSALNNLNPNDIESIEVIKGPAAATLYGAEAANGVIQIITKKGTRGAPNLRWGFRTERANSEWRLLPEDNYTTCDAVKQALMQPTSPTDPTPIPVWTGCQGIAVNAVIADNPMKRDARALRTGDVERYSLNVSGGGERHTFYLAGDREGEQGVFFNSDNQRTSIRTNFGVSPNAKSDFTVSLNWSDGRLRLPIQDESVNGLLLSARRGLAGRRSLFTNPADSGWRTISPTAANRYKNFTDSERLTISGTVNFSPFTWFRNRVTAGFDNTTTQAQLLFLPGDIDASQDPAAASGANLRRTPTRRILTLDYGANLTWNPKQEFAKDFTTTTSFGSQVVADRSETLSATGIGIGAPDVTLVGLLNTTSGNETFSENNSVGYYVQEHIGWRDRLFVTGAVRADDHSSFGSNFDVIVYPKLSVSYILSDEPAAERFLTMARVSSLQLRTAWGQAGRAPSAYSGPQTYTISPVQLGASIGSALRPSAFGNSELKPERGEEIELGFEAGLFSDRMGIDFTYYNKTTTDMLQSIPVAASTGFLGTYLSNLGKVSNSGIELSLSGTPVEGSRVKWDTRFNIATNRNELVSFGIPGKLLENPGGQAYGVVQQHRPGYPLGGFWVTPPLRCGIDGPPVPPVVAAPCPTAVGSAMLTPAGAAIFNPGDTARRYYGTSIPTRSVGFSNNVTLFRYFRLYALLDHMGGHKVFNLQERSRCQAANDNCARVNNPAARFPQGTTAQDSVLFRELAVYRSTTNIAPEWIQPGDFIKLREVSLSVDIPERFVKRARAQSAVFTLSGRNLAVWSDYEGVDPEVNSYGGRNFVRVDAYAAPMMRRLSAILSLQF